jgi:hypothetical protein
MIKAMETTTKSKLISKPGKTSGADNSIKNKTNPTRSSQPTEEQIRDKAKEVYHERLKRGEYGTSLDDWHQAEKLLKGQNR